MMLRGLCLYTLLLTAAPLAAQGVPPRPAAVDTKPDTVSTADSSRDGTDDEGVPLGLQFGVASGALHYAGGRSEQSLAGVLRWAPVHWFSVSTTPTAIRASSPPLAPANQSIVRSGPVDFPVEATVSRAFKARFAPTIAAQFGVTLPVGDTASGFGTGKVGYSTGASLGFAPTEQMWVHLGAGRSLSGVSMQSAFTGANGWGDATAGYSLTERVSLSGGYSSDLGAVDPTIGRSTSVNGGVALTLRGPLTLNVTTSHGLSGAAPSWSLAMGIGTAFPYLRHLDSPSDLLRNAFGGGSHGLGTSGSGSSGRGRHP
jgi:hypothetical protein